MISLLPNPGLVGGKELLVSSRRGVLPARQVPVVKDHINDLLRTIGSGTTFRVPSMNCLRHSNLLIFPEVVLLIVRGLTSFTQAMATPCSSATRASICLMTFLSTGFPSLTSAIMTGPTWSDMSGREIPLEERTSSGTPTTAQQPGRKCLNVLSTVFSTSAEYMFLPATIIRSLIRPVMNNFPWIIQRKSPVLAYFLPLMFGSPFLKVSWLSSSWPQYPIPALGLKIQISPSFPSSTSTNLSG